MVEDLYTPTEVAARLQVKPRTVITWLKDGTLQGIKAGRQWRVRASAIEAYLQAHEVRPVLVDPSTLD